MKVLTAEGRPAVSVVLIILALLIFAAGLFLYLQRGRPMLFALLICAAASLWLLLWALLSSTLVHRILLAVLLLVALCFAALECLVITNSRSDIKDQPQAMVILGAMIWENGPSPILQKRLDTAVSYWETHPDVVIVVSGAKGADEPRSEAEAMFDYLVNRGIPADAILLESRATNTSENLRYASAVLTELGYDTTNLLVVSNGFHLARVKLLAARQGLRISTLSAPAPDWNSRLYYYARESMAIVKSWLMDH